MSVNTELLSSLEVRASLHHATGNSLWTSMPISQGAVIGVIDEQVRAHVFPASTLMPDMSIEKRCHHRLLPAILVGRFSSHPLPSVLQLCKKPQPIIQ